MMVTTTEAALIGHTSFDTAHLASLAHVTAPQGDDTPGARWLRATAQHVADIGQQRAEGHDRDRLVGLHAHLAVEVFDVDLLRVAADLQVELGLPSGARPSFFAAGTVLRPHARALLDRLTA